MEKYKEINAELIEQLQKMKHELSNYGKEIISLRQQIIDENIKRIVSIERMKASFKLACKKLYESVDLDMNFSEDIEGDCEKIITSKCKMRNNNTSVTSKENFSVNRNSTEVELTRGLTIHNFQRSPNTHKSSDRHKKNSVRDSVDWINIKDAWSPNKGVNIRTHNSRQEDFERDSRELEKFNDSKLLSDNDEKELYTFFNNELHSICESGEVTDYDYFNSHLCSFNREFENKTPVTINTKEIGRRTEEHNSHFNKTTGSICNTPPLTNVSSYPSNQIFVTPIPITTFKSSTVHCGRQHNESTFIIDQQNHHNVNTGNSDIFVQNYENLSQSTVSSFQLYDIHNSPFKSFERWPFSTLSQQTYCENKQKNAFNSKASKWNEATSLMRPQRRCKPHNLAEPNLISKLRNENGKVSTNNTKK